MKNSNIAAAAPLGLRGPKAAPFCKVLSYMSEGFGPIFNYLHA